MGEYFDAFYEGSTEISPDEIIGALAIGLALAMACSGLCILGRKRAANVFPVFCGLIFAVSAISMVVGIGHARYKYVGPGKRTLSTSSYPNALHHAGWPGPPHAGPPMRRHLGRALLHEADANKDGRLTPEEAADYIREADSTGQGWVNADDLGPARRRHDAPPSVSENHPEPGAPGSNPRGPEVPDSLE
jgi:hypothetical protein